MSTTDPNFNPSGSGRVKAIKEAVLELEAVFEAKCGDGRRKSLALTHLETAAMYAVKSVFEP